MKKLTGTQKGLIIFFSGFALAFVLAFIFPGGRTPTPSDSQAIQAESQITARSFYKEPIGEIEPSIEQPAPVIKPPKGLAYVFSYQEYYVRPVEIEEPGKPSFTVDDRYLVSQEIKVRQFTGNLGELLRSKLILPDTISQPDPLFAPIIRFEGYEEVTTR